MRSARDEDAIASAGHEAEQTTHTDRFTEALPGPLPVTMRPT